MCKMAVKRSENSVENREFIKTRTLLGFKPVDIQSEVCDIYGEGQMAHRPVCKWIVKFKSRLTGSYRCCPFMPSSNNYHKKNNIKKMNDLLNKDARYTLRDLARLTNFSLARVYGILRKNLQLRKINARWILHLLLDEQKRSPVLNARKLLKVFPKNSKKSFSNLETGDDTCVCYFEPKRKCSNRVWAAKSAVHPGIAKRQSTVKNVLYVIFFDNKGPVMQLPVPKTVTRAFYKNYVLKKLKAHFKRRRPKTGLQYLRLLHDNAPANKASIVTKFLESEKVKGPTWLSGKVFDS